MSERQPEAFDLLVLQVVASLGDAACDDSLRDALPEAFGMIISVDSIRTALDCLEMEGYLQSFNHDGNFEPRLFPQRYWRLTAAGRRAAAEATR